MGIPIPEIAVWLQQEMHECTDIGTDSLVTALSRYRHDLRPADVVEAETPGFVAEARRRLESGLDELQQIQVLYAIQEKRVERALSVEAEEGRVGKMASTQLELAARLLSRSHELKMDLGMTSGSNMRKLAVDSGFVDHIREKHGEAVARALRDPRSRAKVVSIIQQLARRLNASQVLGQESVLCGRASSEQPPTH